MTCRTIHVITALTALAVGRLPTTAQEWRPSERPIFEVGGLTDDLDYALSEVVGGTRLADGRVVIADRLWYGLKMYSPEGELLRSVGGEGEGPGEYEYIRGMGRCAAGMVVGYDLHWDENLYSEDLEFMGTRSAHNEVLGSGPYQSDCNEGGFVLATGWGDRGAHFSAGYFVATAPVVLTHDAQLVHHFGDRLSSERVGSVGPDGSPSGSGPHPFGRQTSVALGPTRAYVGDAADYMVEVYDLTGGRLPDIAWTGPDLRLTSNDFAVLVARAVADAAPSDQPRIRRYYSNLPELERFPAYDRLLTDRVGNLWVRYFPRTRAQTLDWVVFDSNGSKIGEVSLPLRTTLLEAGADYLLVSELDDFDVPTVRVYALLQS